MQNYKKKHLPHLFCFIESAVYHHRAKNCQLRCFAMFGSFGFAIRTHWISAFVMQYKHPARCVIGLQIIMFEPAGLQIQPSKGRYFLHSWYFLLMVIPMCKIIKKYLPYLFLLNLPLLCIIKHVESAIREARSNPKKQLAVVQLSVFSCRFASLTTSNQRFAGHEAIQTKSDTPGRRPSSLPAMTRSDRETGA